METHQEVDLAVVLKRLLHTAGALLGVLDLRNDLLALGVVLLVGPPAMRCCSSRRLQFQLLRETRQTGKTALLRRIAGKLALGRQGACTGCLCQPKVK